jgi:hypothetical protein
MDFLLSLSAKAKEKLSRSSLENLNKSVLYADQLLSEADVSVILPFRHIEENLCFIDWLDATRHSTEYGL